MIESHPSFSYESFAKAAPAVVGALAALGKAVDDSGLEKSLTELVKLRATQLNGCAFCLQFHLNLARRVGVDAAKLDLVGVWRDAGVFSPQERAALAWTEALTLMTDQPERDAAWAQLSAQFSATEAAYLTASIAQINAWNRIAGGLAFPPPARG